MRIAGVVLAAGIGKRMNSSTPKVMHTLCGRSMLQHVINTLRELKLKTIIVVAGKHIEEIKDSLVNHRHISFAFQEKAKGTGDALSKALPYLKGYQQTILIVNGDTPLITRDTLRGFLKLHEKKMNAISLLTFTTDSPASYGRIVRTENGEITSIIESKNATSSQKMIKEVNSGVYAFDYKALPLLKYLKINKLKGEYYLTDIVSIARKKGFKVGAYSFGSEEEFIGVNTPEELERARQLMRERIIKHWRKRDVRFLDSTSVFISSRSQIGRGTLIYPAVHIEGTTRIGKDCTIYPNARILDSILGNEVIIKDATLIEGSVIKKGATIGPFAHLRPGSVIGSEARIGNFVEVKKSVIGSGTKASHLTYLGDARIGKEVNIGAGTITCNYDGEKKNVTTIGDGVFVGSNSELIAPVKIGKGAYIGAGSTITKDISSQALALSRVEQKNIEGWAIKRRTSIQKSKVQRSKVKGRKRIN